MIVLRLGGAVHERVPRAEVTAFGGVEGDRWSKGDAPRRDSQVTLINATVGELIAHEQHGGWDAGDNFHVSLDLSEENLPAGTRLRIGGIGGVGGAILEVTPKPHHGCVKFSARFGSDALRWVNREQHLRRRGIHCEVIEGGEVAADDEVIVLR